MTEQVQKSRMTWDEMWQLARTMTPPPEKRTPGDYGCISPHTRSYTQCPDCGKKAHLSITCSVDVDEYIYRRDDDENTEPTEQDIPGWNIQVIWDTIQDQPAAARHVDEAIKRADAQARECAKRAVELEVLMARLKVLRGTLAD